MQSVKDLNHVFAEYRSQNLGHERQNGRRTSSSDEQTSLHGLAFIFIYSFFDQPTKLMNQLHFA